MGKNGLTKQISRNLSLIQEKMHHSSDINIRLFTLQLPDRMETECALVYLEGLVLGTTITDNILQPLLRDARLFNAEIDADLIDFINSSILTASEIAEISELDELLLTVMSGDVAIIIDGYDRALSVEAKGWMRRTIQPSSTEAVVRGPRDSFIETISQNMMMIRRRLRDPNLVFKPAKVGARARSDILICYIADIAQPELVQEVEKRLQKVDMDIILDSGYVEQMIEDDWWSPFNTLQDTERPDEVVAGLSEGRVAIMVDNSPFVLLAPTTFNSQMLSPEDYYVRWPAANFVRLIRFVASFIAFVTPALYIALVAFHPEMLPTSLALSVAATRSGIPFPSFVEALIMELSLELLREAGIRLPGPIGQTIGIVGGLVIGDAAVSAGVVSPIMVIVVAMTAIAGFIIPTYTLGFGLRITRFFLMILSATFGLYGLTLGLLIVIGHLATLTSFGVSYLSPWAPLNIQDLQDSLMRKPWPSMNKRPQYTKSQDNTRQRTGTTGKIKRKRGRSKS